MSGLNTHTRTHTKEPGTLTAMYSISAPSSAPVHTFGTSAGTGPPVFGTSGPAGPKTFTGGGVPLSAPPGDMGNALTHKQSARVVVSRSHHIADYGQQSKTLLEKEFSIIQLGCRDDLHSSTPPGDQAVLSSLAQTNYSELERQDNEHHNKKSKGNEDLLEHIKSANYAPFGPVIQTDKHLQKGFGDKKCVTNVAVGGRANFANCFIRTAGYGPATTKAPLNVGDGVYMASFVFTCDDNQFCAAKVFRTFNFLIVDNNYSMVPQSPKPVHFNETNITSNYATGLSYFVRECMDRVDDAKNLCHTLCCAFENPGVEIRNAGRVDDQHIHIMCTSVSCVGTIIECPIPNAHSEHPQNVLQGMINNRAEMSTTHPVAVQMTS